MRRKVGRPRKEDRARPTQRLRTMYWARCLKLAVISGADLSKPQGEKVSGQVWDKLKIKIAATQFYYWWKGQQDPSKSLIDKFKTKGVDCSFLSDDKNAFGDHVSRHFAILDSLSSSKRAGIESSIRQEAHVCLSMLDAQWSPCFYRLGTLKPYPFEDSFHAGYFGLTESYDDLKKHYARMGWNKLDLYPGPRVDDHFLQFYDPYSLSSLLVWLVVISPLYQFDDDEFERLALDLATATLCFRVMQSSLSGDLMLYRSSAFGQLILTLSELFFSQDLSEEWLIYNWPFEQIDWPLKSPDIDADEVMTKAVWEVRSVYHSWIERCGYSLKELGDFL